LESAELIAYYRRRAGEYEAIYAKPERQADLAVLRKRIPERLGGGRILDVACGTGYWTEVIARSAASVPATDLADEPMQIARSKVYERSNVAFHAADAYALPDALGRFDAQAGIVGERRQAGGATGVARLGERVLEERIVRLFRFRDAELRLGNDLKVKRRKQFADFADLARVAGGQHQPFHRWYSASQ